MLGEEVTEAAVEQRGLAGDRWWAVVDPDGKVGSGKSGRRFRKMDGLLSVAARYDGSAAVLRFPGGEEAAAGGDDAARLLSRLVGRPVTMATQSENGVQHLDDAAVHLVTTASLRRLRALAPDSRIKPARFRPNFVVDVPGAEFAEDAWVGQTLAVGGVR